MVEQTANGGNVVKGSITWLQMTFERKAGGLEIWVKTRPEIEEFFKAHGEGKTMALSAYGRSWSGVGDEDPLLYNLNEYKPLAIPREAGYGISRPGEALDPAKQLDGSKLNLAFLRLVGISSPAGVKFLVEGPYSKDYTVTLGNKIIEQTQHLIREFIVPVHVSLRITSEDI